MAKTNQPILQTFIKNYNMLCTPWLWPRMCLITSYSCFFLQQPLI